MQVAKITTDRAALGGNTALAEDCNILGVVQEHAGRLHELLGPDCYEVLFLPLVMPFLFKVAAGCWCKRRRREAAQRRPCISGQGAVEFATPLAYMRQPLAHTCRSSAALKFHSQLVLPALMRLLTPELGTRSSTEAFCLLRRAGHTVIKQTAAKPQQHFLPFSSRYKGKSPCLQLCL